jgi:uncharacterized protein (DUF488 family)
MNQLYTVGHSNHDTDHFLGLLREHSVNAIVDVRQFPYSKYVPQYNQEMLRSVLARAEIEYIFMGDYLGARPNDPECYTNGRVDFHKLAKATFFIEGLNRLTRGLKNYRIALMCAEKDPVMCHRTILVCRNMRNPDLQMLHILEDANLEDNRDSETRLLQLHKLWENDLFRDRHDIIEEAYDRQSGKIAASVSEANIEESSP